MKVFIMYTDKKDFIDELCLASDELNSINVYIPHIGETFIDKKRNVEYEVKDVIRSISVENEYGVQVLLEKRTETKYKLKG